MYTMYTNALNNTPSYMHVSLYMFEESNPPRLWVTIVLEWYISF
jgi:hypothetical protein